MATKKPPPKYRVKDRVLFIPPGQNVRPRPGTVLGVSFYSKYLWQAWVYEVRLDYMDAEGHHKDAAFEIPETQLAKEE